MKTDSDNTNALISINDVPDGLLCDIFLISLARRAPVKIVDIRKTLISICLACKRWHELAYNYTLLWTQVIDFEKDNAEYIADLLRRSGSAPLEIGMDSAFDAVQQQHKQSVEVLRTIFEHRSRIKNMNLSIRYAPWEFICQNFLDHPAPNLEFLNLITSCPFPDCSFSGPLFANHAPRLTQFHMQRCLADFSSPVLHNLTALSVSDIVAPGQLFRQTENSASVAPTVESWLQILQNMTALRHLTLVNSITRTNNLEAAKCSNVLLPCLRLFSLSASLDEGAVLLKFLKIPPSCGIRLRCKDRSPTVEVGPVILATLGNQLSLRQDLPQGEEQYLQAKLLDGDRIHFGNSRRIGQPWNITEADELTRHAKTSADPLVWLVLTFTNDFPIARRFIRQLLALYEPTFPTTTDLDLWIDEQSIVTHEDVAFLSTLTNFGAFPAIKRLDLYGQSLVHLLPLFDSLSQPDEPIFPSLRLLRLTGTIFNDRDDQVYQIVLNFLRCRAVLNAPLWRIVVSNGEISSTTRSNLQERSKVEVVGLRTDSGQLELTLEGMTLRF
jgi:hypothetical protein